MAAGTLEAEVVVGTRVAVEAATLVAVVDMVVADIAKDDRQDRVKRRVAVNEVKTEARRAC